MIDLTADVTVSGILVEPNDEQLATVSVQVEFADPFYCLTEDQRQTPGAETCAHMTALGNLWIALRRVGCDAGELLESIEARYQNEKNGFDPEKLREMVVENVGEWMTRKESKGLISPE